MLPTVFPLLLGFTFPHAPQIRAFEPASSLSCASRIRYPASFRSSYEEIANSAAMNITATGTLWASPTAQRKALTVYVVAGDGSKGSYVATSISNFTENTSTTFKAGSPSTAVPVACTTGPAETVLPLWNRSISDGVPCVGSTFVEQNLADVFLIE